MNQYFVLLLSMAIGAMGAPAMADPPSNLQVFTPSGSFTVPAGITKIEVEVRGGGGGGGGGVTGQGGCGGGYGKQVLTVAAGTVHAVTVGAGGAGGASGVNGIAGGASSFGTLISATGGGGGAFVPVTNSAGGTSCAGGTSTAALNMTGEIGERSMPESHPTGSVVVPFNRGGACGDGSSIGLGGRGNQGGTGSPGRAGNVVVRW